MSERAVESFTLKETLTFTTELSFITIEPGLYLFQKQMTSKIDAVEGGQKEARNVPRQTGSGFVNEAGRQEMLAGGSLSTANLRPLRWLHDTEKEILRLQGFEALSKTVWETQDAWSTRQAHPDLTAENLVVVDYPNYTISDRHGVVLPTALYFSYITNHISESSHDLEALYAHLAQRSDVRVHVGKQKREETPSTLAKEATTFKSALFEIPYYNAEEGRTQSLQFTWAPQVDDFRKLFTDTKYTNRHEKVLSNDILGLEQFRRPTTTRRLRY